VEEVPAEETSEEVEEGLVAARSNHQPQVCP